MNQPAKKMYSHHCGLLVRASAKNAIHYLSESRIKGICLATDLFIIEMQREDLERINNPKGNAMYEPNLVEIENEMDRREVFNARNEEALREKVINAISGDDYSGEVLSETLPYESEKWSIFLSELKKHAKDKHADTCLIGRMVLDSALAYIQSAEKA